MKKLFVIAVAAATVLSLQLVAQNPAQNAAQGVKAAIDAATAAMGTATLQSVQYSGTGAVFPTGQAYTTGGPWPKFTVTKYT
ncbi:MAG: Lactamase protein, partial [Acidobacteria bacterium]|nr:Lactamase protein [Acidobacteriota bacterium]